MTSVNEFDQQVGDSLPNWRAAQLPTASVIEGRYCRLEKLDAERHAADLYSAFATATDGRDWTYMPEGPFLDLASYRTWCATAAASTDPRHYAVINPATSRATGTMSLMRHDPMNGVIEVGWVALSPLLQRTVASTEAHFLLMQYAFDELGYRRYEWKCDNLNAPSMKAAQRLGFTYEGTFRQAVVYKGRNRDTAWFSIIDKDWPRIQTAFEQWLDPSNFDEQGMQLNPLRTQLH